MQPSTLKSQPLIADKGRQDEVEEKKGKSREWKKESGKEVKEIRVILNILFKIGCSCPLTF